MIDKIKQKAKSLIAKASTIALREQNTQVTQVMLSNQYKIMKSILSHNDMPTLSDVGFKVYSQFEEDGILLYIFSIIGVTNKRVVEICVADGAECMATNLIINHGWEGLLFDGDINFVNKGIKFFSTNSSTYLLPPIYKHAWLTRDNVNQLILESGFKGEIDLLSLDIDGNDYHIMEAINVIRPRVIICETHDVIPSNLALTIPYTDNFNYLSGTSHKEFRSVSLLAMKQLLSKKGYRLIGSHKYGFNAIFILNELGVDYFPEVTVESVHNNPYTKFRRESVWNQVKDLPWIEV